ncbi:MAG: DUF2125 domain-containing protein, partial [Alphaproteobacteria bacterium]|nr:DUF2125 domain-containing protein [Alphaproteobacteria bacterium]
HQHRCHLLRLVQIISYLNEFNLDLAYDKIEFNSMFFSPLVKISGLQLYNTKDLNNWALKFDEIKVYSNVFGDTRVRLDFSNNGLFSFNDFSTKMNADQTILEVSVKNNQIKEIIFHSEDINLHNFAKIKKAAFLVQKSKTANNQAANTTLPSYESFFEINDVEINGLVDYPLSSHLKLIYTKASVIGIINPEDQLTASLETWLKDGGFIEVPNLVLQWNPLTLVGRGNINFNEYFSPRLSFNTSSKGLLKLLNDLQKNGFLDSKNVFVANILLSNKAFKLNPEDEELTISTPITYADGEVNIENLTIKDFNK